MSGRGTGSKITENHDEIRKWVQAKGGMPAIARRSDHEDDGIGMLRIWFPGESEDGLEFVTWDRFFERFENHHLAFEYSQDPGSFAKSDFFKFINRKRNL